ncbi:MAG: DUF4097 domain-containing protein [Oscillochloris sp.]|nr:DUF4097 domain-containing protein [Oscillochloris sp.]
MPTDTLPRSTPPESYERSGQFQRWGGLLLLLGVVWLVFELTSRDSFVGFDFVQRSADVPSQSFTATHLVVRAASDSITLEHAKDDQVTVAAVRHGFGWDTDTALASLNAIDVQIDQQGDTLQVEVRRSGLAGLAGRSPFVDLRISVPTETVLDVQTVSGSLHASGLQASGSLSTVSGAITLDDIGGDLTVGTTSGDVQISRARAGLHVETVSGDVRLAEADGALRAHTISGDLDLQSLRDVQIDLETTSGDVQASGALAGQISTISGDVQLRLPDASDLKLIITTVSGDLSSDLDLREAQRARRSLSGSLGAGEEALTISTTSGDVVVDGE